MGDRHLWAQWNPPLAQHGHSSSQAKAVLFTLLLEHMVWGYWTCLWGKEAERQRAVMGCRRDSKDGRVPPLSVCPPEALTYPWAEAEVRSHSGFGLGHSKSDESSQARHAQGHASNNGHAY